MTQETNRAPGRRIGAENSETRARLIAAAQDIMATEGAAGLTTGKLARKVGLQRHIVHYYFGNLDNLHVILAEIAGEETADGVNAVIADRGIAHVFSASNDHPIAQDSWHELQTLASRSEPVRQVVRRNMTRVNDINARALQARLDEAGIRPAIAPATFAILMWSIGFAVSMLARLGLDAHRRDVLRIAEALLGQYLATGTLAGVRAGDDGAADG